MLYKIEGFYRKKVFIGTKERLTKGKTGLFLDQDIFGGKRTARGCFLFFVFNLLIIFMYLFFIMQTTSSFFVFCGVVGEGRHTGKIASLVLSSKI